ncbi:MAG: class I tRNA ligase family protein, partial [Ignavibacteriae bacterium]|nr:class I tRNA ligase family protein [Ignavibacteriota bacterium]
EEVKSAVLTRALYHFDNMLRMIHPFMPFLSEELWSLIAERKDGESISVAQFPQLDKSAINKVAESKMDFVQSIITSIRNIRGEMNIPPSKKIDALLKTKTLEEDQIKYIQTIARINYLEFGADITKPKASASSVIKDCEIYIPLEGLIDLHVERDRLTKEIQRLEGALIGVNKKLSNERFVNNAPKEVVANENAKKTDWENSLEKLKSILEDLT